MAQIKLRIVLNKGRRGASLAKLGDVTRQLEKFLRSLAADLKIEVKPGEWLAENFRNSSVVWDASYQADVSTADARHFAQCMEFITDFDPDVDGPNGLVTDTTLLEYSRIGEAIDPDEAIGVGIFSPRGGKPKMRSIEYRKASRLRRAIETPITSYGSVQGIVYSWTKEAPEPFIHVRELATAALIKGFYGSDLYSRIVVAVAERASVVHVSGKLTFDRAKRTIQEMQIERLDMVQPLSDDEFHSVFGSAPDFTGALSTKDYIRELREDA